MIVCRICGAHNPDDATECSACQAALIESQGAGEDQAEPDDTAQIPAVRSEWSREALRRAANLLMAGKSREVARLCNEVIDAEPQNVAAYELLAMAEEESGNLHLALQAYERIVALDPGRNFEEEKISALREQLAAEPPEAEDEESRHLKSLNRWATVALVGSLLLLVAVVGSLFVIKARNARLVQHRQEQAFAAAVTRGEGLLEAGRYAQAIRSFQQADQIKPQNRRVYELWTKAYREYLAALERDQLSMGGKLALDSRPNPFEPVWIGPRPDSSADATAARGGARQYVPPPPMWEGELPPPLPDGQQGPLEDFLRPDERESPDEAATNPNILEPPATGGPGSPRKTAGDINIWVEPSPTRAAVARADELRVEADNQRRRGNYEKALGGYTEALERYQQEIKEDPSTAAGKRAAIESVKKAIKACEQHSGE